MEKLPGSPPLDTRGKFDYYLKSLTSQESLSRIGLTTGLRQITGGEGSYSEVLGARYAEHVTKRTVQFGIGALRGEDPRFRRSGEQGFWNRTKFVLSRTVLTDMDNGGTSIAAGRLTGSFTANTLARYWTPG
jgi:hypothetical protein